MSNKARKLIKAKKDNVFESIKYLSYFSFPKKSSSRQLLDTLFAERKISNFSFVINPLFLQRVQPEVHDYVLFIDTRRADYYQKVKEYFENRKTQFNTYMTTGDMDFITYYSSTEIIHNSIKADILALLNEAPKDSNDELVISYKVDKIRQMKGKRLSGYFDEEAEFPLDEKILLSNAVINYRADNFIEKFESERKLIAYLDKLEKENIIEGFYTINEIDDKKIHVVVLIQYTASGYYESVVLLNKDINKHLVDVFEIRGDDIKDKFYKKADFALHAVFSNIEEYHIWKEKIYEASLKNNALINIMTFIVEQKVSEITQAVGDIREFENLCKKYNGSSIKNILIGKPYYFGNVINERGINIKTDWLKDHGMIIGFTNSGKTYTSMLLAKKMLDQKIRVHFFDCTNGIYSKLKTEFQDLYTDGKVILHEVKDFNNLEFFEEDAIHVYSVKEESFSKFLLGQFEIMKNRADTLGRKTTDVIFFEEANIVFRMNNVVEEIFTIIQHLGRKGISMWFSTQNYAHFPLNSGTNENLTKELKNRIIHKVNPQELDEISQFLYSFDKREELNISLLHEELKGLTIGEAIVSFFNGSSSLKPVKVAIPKE